MEKFGKFIWNIIVMVIKLIIIGFTFMKLWIWFIVPIFDLPDINIFAAVGLTMVIRYPLTTIPSKKRLEEFNSEKVHNFSILVVLSGFMLLIGYLVSLYI